MLPIRNKQGKTAKETMEDMTGMANTGLVPRPLPTALHKRALTNNFFQHWSQNRRLAPVFFIVNSGLYNTGRRLWLSAGKTPTMANFN